jgi:hypothetical protein
VDLQGRLSNPTIAQAQKEALTTLACSLPRLETVSVILPQLLARQPVRDGKVTKIQRKARLSEADVSQLVEDHRSGLTVVEISRRYGIHRSTVMGHLRRTQTLPS